MADASVPPPPSPQAVRRARLFWEQAAQDHGAARDKQRGHAPLEAAYLSFQAALNALTAVCYLNGRFQLPNFSTARMAALCAEVDGRFEAILAACEALEAVQERSPFDAAPDAAALDALGKASVGHGTQVLEAVRGYLKEHRKRFFAP
jgi:hypothetical protein